MHSIFRCVKYPCYSSTCFTCLKQVKTLQSSPVFWKVWSKFKSSIKRCHSSGFSMFKAGVQCLPGKPFCAFAAGKAGEAACEWEGVFQDVNIYPWLAESCAPSAAMGTAQGKSEGSSLILLIFFTNAIHLHLYLHILSKWQYHYNLLNIWAAGIFFALFDAQMR